MANLTIAIDDDLLHRARVRAAQLGTSVNAVLREYQDLGAGRRRPSAGESPSARAGSAVEERKRGSHLDAGRAT